MSEQEENKKETLKARRNKKGALTRSLNILSSSIDAKHEKEVIEKAMEKLQVTFGQLEEVHEALTDLITDEEEFTQAESYMETCQKEYTQCLQTGTKYLSELNESVRKEGTEQRPEDRCDQPDKSVHEVARFMLKKDLMTNGLVRFDDNPMNYRQWKATFKGVIEELKLTPREESDLLIRWLGPKSTQSMMRLRAVHSNDPTTGLKAIWERLDEEYGAAELIEGLLISKLETHPKIGRDQPVKLREFADFLCELQAAKNDASLSGLAFLDTSRGVGMAVEKLPFSLQEGWRKTGSRYKETEGVAFPPFKVFVDYISKQAKVRNDPSFRPPQIQPKSSHSSQSPWKGSQARSFSSSSTPTKQRGCVCCNNADHWIDECDTFKTMSLNERDHIVRAKGLCRGCLKRGHIWRNCMRRQACEICKGPHPTILHRFQAERATTPPEREVHTTVTHSHCNRLDTTDEGDCVSSIVPVMVECNGSEVLTYAMLDEQSDACFMTDTLRGKLGASGTNVNLEISTILSRGTVSSVRIKGLTVKGLNQTEVINLPATYTREVIPVAASQIPTQHKVKDWTHLKRVGEELSPLLREEVGLLIGATCPQALTPLEVIPGRRENDPYAVRTKLGWSVVGVASKAECSVKIHFAFRTTTKQVLRVLERDFVDMEIDEPSMSVNDARFLDVLNKGVEKVDFQLPLPFKFDRPTLPNNRGVALKRLDHLKRKLTKDERYAGQYRKFMERIVEEGQAERVPEEEQSQAPRWYIPHHGVYHPRKEDKLRVVLDCASRCQGVSLNEVLLQGPNLTNSLTGVLLRFRKERIAVVGDIEGMFYQVRVAPDDRDYLRYLWWDDGDMSTEPHDYRMKVHVFGAASSPGCANYALKKTAERYEDQYGSDAANFVRRGFYVDDGLVSVSTVDEALSLTTRAVAMLKEGGFRLHKLISNSKEVLQALPKDAIASTCGMLDLSDLPTERTLGILWNAEKDKFQFEAALKDRPPTRRGILSTVSAVFDPLGFLGPYVLTGKRILQRLCVSGTDWDEEIDEDILNEWNNWKKQLAFLEDISIDRCHMPGSFRITTVELHHFSDASEKGYGQCSYVRLVDDHGNVKVSLLISKCRVSPSKVTTIPRLELMAATVSVRMATLLRKELEYDGFSEHFWTDSKVVLGYINNEARRFHTFVANRIQQIRNGSDPKQWHYVPSPENPADIASRGMDAEGLRECSMWWNGPKFLSEDYVIEDTDYEQMDNDVEVKKSRVFAAQVKTTLIPEVLERMSSWTKARRVLARCLIFISKLKKTRTSEKITVDDLMEAEKLMIKSTQDNEFRDLANLTKLNPMTDNDGLIRVGGRLKKSNLSQEIKHPVILPARSDLTRLIVSHYHHQVHHQGRGITLNAIRAAGFWIIGGVSTVTRYIFRCVLCRRLRRDPEVQKMADLPADRLEPAPTFTYSGVDYFGPFIARNGRKEEKRYGVIFTCLVTRSVHLEVANSLSTDSFLNAFRRFICRRGAVRQLRSDRGTNFVGAEAELQKAMKGMDQDVLQDELLKLNCDWVFNTPTASHHGGVWERMIRTTRSILNSIMFQHKALFNDEMLNTFMAEAEAIINSRPLTTTNEASVEPLTPAHLLTLKNSVVMPPPGKFVHNDKFSRMRWRRVQHLAEEFWCRWKKEYVAHLQLRQRWTKEKRNMKEGDIVLLCDENTPRNQWQLSKVVKVQPSDDGLVRKVSVFVGSRKSTLDRPVNKLVLLVPVEETQ